MKTSALSVTEQAALTDASASTCKQALPLTADGDRTQPLIQVRDLTVRYSGELALQSVDLDVRENKITALIGPSGCGKTSFLMALNRLSAMIRGCTVDGQVRFGGTELSASTPTGWLRRQVGMVFQRPNPFPVSIERNLHLPLREHGCPKRELKRRSEDLLKRVGLWEEVAERLGEPAQSLSGGQQQRLCLARALALNPRVLLMDEPCSALDPISTAHIEELINSLRSHVTIIIVTHNLAQARRLADDVAVFWNCGCCGCLIESGPASQVFESPQHPDTVSYLRGITG